MIDDLRSQGIHRVVIDDGNGGKEIGTFIQSRIRTSHI